MAASARPPLIIVAHRILIGAAVAFGAFYTAWEAVAWRRTGGLVHLGIAVAAALLTAALGYYLRHLDRFVDTTGRRPGANG